MAGLDGKAALVTGGSRGIGRAIAERLAADGADAQDAVESLDILVNNAGIAPTGLIADVTDEEFDAVLAANLKSPFVLIREAARRLRDGGRIISISTINTVLPGPGMAAYASSKAALELLSRVAAYELGARGITVTRAGRQAWQVRGRPPL